MYRTLISTAELAAALEMGNVAVVDCRFSLADKAGGRKAHAASHIPGAVYERNFGISHEDYGRLAIGAMTSRAWSVCARPSRHCRHTRPLLTSQARLHAIDPV